MRTNLTSLGAIVFGICIGALLFFTLFEMPSVSEKLQRTNVYRWSGTVSAVDTAAGTITVLLPGNYPFDAAPRLARFAYTEETLWASFEYRFEDGVVVSRITHMESPRELPPGTMVTLQADDTAGAFEALAIVFLRRTNM